MEDTQKTSLNDNENIQEFIKILKDNKMDTFLNDFKDTLAYASSLEKQLDKITGELEYLNEQITKMRENPVKRAVKGTIKNIENKLNKAKELLNNVKNNIVQNVNKALNDVKQRGLYSINSTLNFLHIKDGLNKIQKTLNAVENQIDKAVKELESLDKQVQKTSVIKDLKAKKKEAVMKKPVEKEKKAEIII